jgi:hypothetical protein
MSTESQPARTRDEVRAHYHGHHDHVRSLGAEAIWIGLQGIVLAVSAIAMWTGVMRWGALAGSVALIATMVGILRAFEWGRVLGAIVEIAFGVIGIALIISGNGERKLPITIVCLLTGLYLLTPMARKAFQDARGARARAATASS